jgi:uncharacterized protein YggL (DUF469 family)
MAKNQKMTVQVQVTVPEGTSRTKVEKAVKTLLQSGIAPEGYKLGAPKVVEPETAPAAAATECAASAAS